MMRKSKSKMTATGLAPAVAALFFLAGCDEAQVSAPDAQTPMDIGTAPSAATASPGVDGTENSSDANGEAQPVTAGTSPESMDEVSNRPRSGSSRAAPVPPPIQPADASAVTPTAEPADPHAGHDMQSMPDHDMKDM
jgi:hypothetical protein|tara:strand:- start:334 stop:744 length:411 start_codon:yes stop_codon:yes gene_type:complete